MSEYSDMKREGWEHDRMAETKPDRAAVAAAREMWPDNQRLIELQAGDWWSLVPGQQQHLAEIISRHYAPLVEAAERALAMFDKGHAIDRFDWGKSALTGENIAELNEVPAALRSALDAVRGKK